MRLRDSLGTVLAALHTVVIAFAMYVTWPNHSRSDYWLVPLVVDFPASFVLLPLASLCCWPFSNWPMHTQNTLAWLFTYLWSLLGGGAWWFLLGWLMHGGTGTSAAPNSAPERTPAAGDAGSAGDAPRPR